METSAKLWGGRFSSQAHDTLVQLNSSLSVDKRLFDEDISGSVAYAKALQKANLLTEAECLKIETGLEEVRRRWTASEIQFLPSDEDVHTVNERMLVELIGPEIGGKLHTGRSRNDQVATDMKLWMKMAIRDIQGDLRTLILDIICQKAKLWIDILMPGYTHLQRGQPIRFSHWLLSYAFYFESDYKRLSDLLVRADQLPLGSGAIAGNPFNIDRHELANELGFSSVTMNSMFGVGDRDFVVEFNFVNSLISSHMSRFAEDLILFSTHEFGYVRISDAFSTGSSLMPQKRNPDSLELIRGISGEVFGKMSGFMMTMKGLPSTYNKDMQSDKRTMFEIYDQVRACFSVLGGVLGSMDVNAQRCKAALSTDMLATDIAYYLVGKGLAFRTSHHVAGEVVKYSEEQKIPIQQIPLETLKSINKFFGEDFQDKFDFEASVEQYKTVGGTSRESVQNQIQHFAKFFNV